MVRDKGITLIALVITVIVLSILASVTTYTGISTVRNAKYYNAISELKIMQSKVNEMYEDYKNGNNTLLENGISISNSAKETQAIEAYDEVKNVPGMDIGNKEDFRYYSSRYIKNNLDIEGISLDFIINIKTRTVILVEGVKMNENVYYALSQIEGEQYNVKYENEV